MPAVPKSTRYVNPAITKHARGQACTMQSPDCNNNPETVVFCHSNMVIHGKGVGLKSHDFAGCFACSGCHHWYDFGKEPLVTKKLLFYDAMSRTLAILFRDGVIK